MNSYGVKSLEIYTQPYFTRFLTNNNYLRCIGALRRSDYTLPKPGIQTLPDFSLKLNGYCAVWQVNWFVHSSGDCVLEVVTKT